MGNIHTWLMVCSLLASGIMTPWFLAPCCMWGVCEGVCEGVVCVCVRVCGVCVWCVRVCG